MNRLTAAHPTLPLPSYARVTDLDNGASIVVRVNDRGPFANGRIIDLSRRAAELLDYKDDGVAKVRVDYIGPAPLDVNDDPYLMASYRPGKGIESAPGLNTGVMLAMDGTTPSSRRPATFGLPRRAAHHAGCVVAADVAAAHASDHPGLGLTVRSSIAGCRSDRA